MSISRHYGPDISYSNTTVPTGGPTTVLDFSGAIPGTITAGDEMFVSVAQEVITSGSLVVNIPTGWEIIANTPRDIGGSAVSIMRWFYRKATGSADDNPIFTCTQSGSSTTRELYLTGNMWLYHCTQSERLVFHSTGSIGSGTSGSPTLAFYRSCPKDSVFMSGAYQIANDTTPTMSASNGFYQFVSNNPAGSKLPPSVGISDQFLVGGDIDGPQWTVTRGSWSAEHHDVYLIMRVIRPGLVLPGSGIGDSLGGLV